MYMSEVIRKYYEYANEGNWDAWCALFADDMVMDEQLAGHVDGLARLRPMMGGMKTMYSKFQNVPKKIIVKDDEAAVISHISAASAAGAPIEADVMNYFRMDEGKIVYMSNFHDSGPFAPILNSDDVATTEPKAFPIIHRFPGRFMELPRDHVNAYIIELENSVMVIDTTLALSSARELRAMANSFEKPIQAVLLTHGHPDHYTGLVAFGDVPRIASQGCLDFARQEDMVKADTASGFLGEDYPPTRIFPDKIIEDGYTCVYDGVTFTFQDLGPAESPSDGMWIIEKKDGVKHAFIGDVMASDCHCFFRDGHTVQWNQVLERLRTQFDDSVRFYIGHGESPVGKEMINWQLGYNRAFLDAVEDLEDKTVPVSQASQDAVLTKVKAYLPNEATLFLLAYELGETIALHFPNKGFGVGQGRQFYLEQLGLIGQGKIDQLIQLHYHPDAAIVTFDGIHHGRPAIKEYVMDTLRRHQKVTSLVNEYFTESEDVILFRATVTSEGRGTIDAQDAFFMKDGQILRHIALTLVPDADYEALGTRWKDDGPSAEELQGKALGEGLGRLFYQEQLELIGSGQIDKLVEDHYHPDAVIVTFDGIHHGRPAIKNYVMDTLNRHQKVTYLATEFFAESEDVIIFRATVKSEGRGTINAQDAFLMKDGKIFRHIALTLVPDADYEKLGTRWKD
ncbi:MAG: nuclear transport factor 2 family protein [Candidatus Thiodiazotropha sp. (ex Epidulcina cf. delphinae)]|nr:nuclear transport factor 2 family protein [Candidatus Thiodiazotropha sp. (ex Epidulcina cf. delphinae)]